MDVKLGAIQSPPDHRDYLYRAIVQAEALPRKYSRRRMMGPVRDQGQYGTCVGFASAAVKDSHEGLITSPLYIYANAKKLDGIPNQEGTYCRTAMSVLLNKGVCPEDTLPYNQMRWPNLPTPTATADSEALAYRVKAYASVLSIDEVKQSIVRDGPVLAAVLVCDSFVNAKDGYIPLPGSEGKADYIRGGHAVCVVGYDDDLAHGPYRGYFEVKNSWGPNWGQEGYCWIPYDFFNFRQPDIGMTYWWESWTSIDIITPPVACTEGYLWIGSKTAVLDGREVELDQPPTINPSTGRTRVPLRFMAEHMGYQVDWSDSLRQIHFYKRK
mgnify:FL=1